MDTRNLLSIIDYMITRHVSKIQKQHVTVKRGVDYESDHYFAEAKIFIPQIAN